MKRITRAEECVQAVFAVSNSSLFTMAHCESPKNYNKIFTDVPVMYYTSLGVMTK
jgi:hypothetical protein